MDFFVTSTITLGIWGALGPLVGIRYGQDLARKWQREHWVADSKKREYQELLGVITESFATFLACYTAEIKTSTPAMERELDQANRRSLQIMSDRIFIAQFIDAEKIRDRWTSALKNFEKKGNYDEFIAAFSGIRTSIIEAALENTNI